MSHMCTNAGPGRDDSSILTAQQPVYARALWQQLGLGPLNQLWGARVNGSIMTLPPGQCVKSENFSVRGRRIQRLYCRTGGLPIELSLTSGPRTCLEQLNCDVANSKFDIRRRYYRTPILQYSRWVSAGWLSVSGRSLGRPRRAPWLGRGPAFSCMSLAIGPLISG